MKHYSIKQRATKESKQSDNTDRRTGFAWYWSANRGFALPKFGGFDGVSRTQLCQHDANDVDNEDKVDLTITTVVVVIG